MRIMIMIVIVMMKIIVITIMIIIMIILTKTQQLTNISNSVIANANTNTNDNKTNAIIIIIIVIISSWAESRPRSRAAGRPAGQAGTSTANLRTTILDLRGFDSSRILILRGRSPMSIANFPESLSQRILVGIISVGGLGVASRPATTVK